MSNNAFSIDPLESDFGERLDVCISTHLENQSRKRVTELIKDGTITVSGFIKKPGYKVKPGDKISGTIPFIKPISAIPENIDIEIIYEDEEIIIINKQPGLVVHPAPGNYTGTLVNALLYHFPELSRDDNDLRPGIVHRLDKDTSGVMVVAKNPQSQAILSEQFKERSVSKTYMALVHGVPEKEGLIDKGIGRHPNNRKKMSVLGTNRKFAITRWKTIEDYDFASMIECNIETGRTHQIRVHCAHINHHILGDQVYGLEKREKTDPFKTVLRGISRQMLHAKRLQIDHPVTGMKMEFEVPPPPDMQKLIERLKD